MTSARLYVGEPYRSYCNRINDLHRSFDSDGFTIHSGRNLIKTVTMTNPGGESIKVVVKAFKVPSRPRGFMYAHLRQPKARRSMIHAQRLLERGIRTPDPVACVEYTNFGCLRHSYYVCRYWRHDHDLTALLYKGAAIGWKTDVLLKQLALFTFRMHQSGVMHLDYHPGNILTRSTGDAYDFALVDLNRIKFKYPDTRERLTGLLRLTTITDYLVVMGREYAEVYGVEPTVFLQELMKIYSRFKNTARRIKSIKSFFR